MSCTYRNRREQIAQTRENRLLPADVLSSQAEEKLPGPGSCRPSLRTIAFFLVRLGSFLWRRCWFRRRGSLGCGLRRSLLLLPVVELLFLLLCLLRRLFFHRRRWPRQWMRPLLLFAHVVLRLRWPRDVPLLLRIGSGLGGRRSGAIRRRFRSAVHLRLRWACNLGITIWRSRLVCRWPSRFCRSRGVARFLGRRCCLMLRGRWTRAFDLGGWKRPRFESRLRRGRRTTGNHLSLLDCCRRMRPGWRS